MMPTWPESLLLGALGNGVVVAVLAPLVMLVERIVRRPALANRLWLLLMLKLVTPPLFTLEQPRPAPKAKVTVNEVAPPALAKAAGPSARVPSTSARLAPQAHRTPARVAGLGSLRRVAVTAGVPRWFPTVALLWLGGSVAALFSSSARLVRARLLLRAAQPAPDEMQQRVRMLARRYGLPHCPDLVLLPGVLSPALWAAGGRHVLLMPCGLWDRLDDDGRDALLAHELAHLRRRDHWVRLLELVVVSVYWWFPVAWWVRRALRESEEMCCDAWVLWAVPGGARSYAKTLLDAVDFLAESAPLRLAGASGMGDFSTLKRRLDRIMVSRTFARVPRGAAASLLGFAAVLLPLAPPAPGSYHLTDLGTLGGPNSDAKRVNEAGWVLGYAMLADGSLHYVLTAPGGPIDPRTDDLTLHIPQGHVAPEPDAMDLNNRGQVLINTVGSVEVPWLAQRPAVPGSSPLARRRWDALVLDAAGWRDVGRLEEANFPDPDPDPALAYWNTTIRGIQGTVGYALNDAGQVAGAVFDVVRFQSRAFRTAPARSIDARADDLGDLGYRIQYMLKAEARAINRRGVVAGTAVGGNRGPHAFRTAPGRPIDPRTDDLGTLGGEWSRANAINDLGQVAGQSERAGPWGGVHAFRTAPRQPIDPRTDDLGTLGGRTSEATAMNNAGHVVGASTIGERQWEEPLPKDVLAKIGRQPRNERMLGGSGRRPLGPDLNIKIHGWPVNLLEHAFLHDGQQMIDLNDRIPPRSGWVLLCANDINDRGQIVGRGLTPDGCVRGFLLTPARDMDALLVMLGGTLLSSAAFTARRLLGAA
jgi:probable HAF family extracellular repeat protein